jgi:hypothetical protein
VTETITSKDIVVIKDATLLCELEFATVLGLPTGHIVVMPDYFMDDDVWHALKAPLVLSPEVRTCLFREPQSIQDYTHYGLAPEVPPVMETEVVPISALRINRTGQNCTH